MGIGKTLHRALSKLVMREAGDQENTACGSIQLCAGLGANIEGSTHTVGQRILEISRARHREEEAEASDVKEETENVVVVMGNLTKETAGTEEEAAEGLEASLGMEIEEAAEVNGEE